MTITTTPQLFALAEGHQLNPGPHACFYCGAPCDEQHTAKDHVAKSFTERNAVAASGSDFVCIGCTLCLRGDRGSVPLVDGSTHLPKEGGKRKPKPGAEGNIQTRWFSWVITRGGALGGTPAHRSLLEQLCLVPPTPPFAICLTDGNKHHLYRTPVNHATDRIAVNCEGVIADYAPDQLRERIDLVCRLVAVVGKGSSSIARLMDPREEMSLALQMANHDSRYDEVINTWSAVRNQPLSKLALWLCPAKEEAHERVSSAATA